MPKPKEPPYLAFALDALPAARNAALAAGLPRAEGPDALLSLWEHAWRQQVEWVPATVMLGCCSGHERLPEALRAFGFLEPVAAGWTSLPVTPEPIPVDGYRIKGARRYLRVGSPQSLGGQAAKGNLIPGARYRTSAERKGAAEQPVSRLPLGILSAEVSADSRHQRAATIDDRAAESQHLAGASGDPPGTSQIAQSVKLVVQDPTAPGTANGEQAGQQPPPAEISRPEPTSGTTGAGFALSAPQQKRGKVKAQKADKPADPRIRELSNVLTSTYKTVTGNDYSFQGPKDGAALVRLVGQITAARTIAVIGRRFATALRVSYNPVTGIANFEARFNDPRWGGDAAATAQRDVRRGTVRAEDEHHEQGGSIRDF